MVPSLRIEAARNVHWLQFELLAWHSLKQKEPDAIFTVAEKCQLLVHSARSSGVSRAAGEQLESFVYANPDMFNAEQMLALGNMRRDLQHKRHFDMRQGNLMAMFGA